MKMKTVRLMAVSHSRRDGADGSRAPTWRGSIVVGETDWRVRAGKTGL